MSALFNNKPSVPPPKLSLEKMVKEDLGYCCLEFFFLRYRKTETIALRLGLTQGTVRKWKHQVDQGLYGDCNDCERCIKKKLGKPTVKAAARAFE